MEEHLVVERIVDPTTHDLLKAGKIQDHPQPVQLRGRQRDHGPAVVAVQMPAFAIVIQQTMPIAERKLTCYAVHGASRSYAVRSTIPAAAKAWRRSAHLLHRPQCRPPTGRMHEKVHSSGKACPRRSTVTLAKPAR